MKRKTLWRKFTQDHELIVMYKGSELLAVLKRKFGEIYNDTEGDDAEI